MQNLCLSVTKDKPMLTFIMLYTFSNQNPTVIPNNKVPQYEDKVLHASGDVFVVLKLGPPTLKLQKLLTAKLILLR